jgi:hypothetical protein
VNTAPSIPTRERHRDARADDRPVLEQFPKRPHRERPFAPDGVGIGRSPGNERYRDEPRGEQQVREPPVGDAEHRAHRERAENGTERPRDSVQCEYPATALGIEVAQHGTIDPSEDPCGGALTEQRH